MVRIYDRTYNSIKALIFDKDGTLAQSQVYLEQQAKSRFEAILATIDRQHPERNISPSLQTSIFASWGIIAGQVDPAGLLAVGSKRQNAIVTAGHLTPLGLGWIEALQLVEEAFGSVSLSPTEKAHLTPPIQNLELELSRLRRLGLKLALLSADIQENVQAFAQVWNLESHFDLILGEQAGLPKPNPALLDLVCDRLQVNNNEVLVFGDSAADIQLAKQGGAAGAIGYPAGWPYGKAKEIPQADQHLKNLADIQIEMSFSL